MNAFPLLSVLIFLPLAGALLILLARGAAASSDAGTRVKTAGLAVMLANFVMSLWLLAEFDNSQPGFQLIEKSPWFAGFSYQLGVDGMSVLLILLTTFLTPLCLLASWNSIKTRITEFVIAFLVLETLIIGVFCALDLLVFYIFFEAVLIPMFLIIGIWGGDNRRYAAFKFFLYTLLGSLLLLAAVIYIYIHTGTADIILLQQIHFAPEVQTWLWLAFFASFAVKLPMWPVHTWLPDAHVQAPTGGSVILAGILLKMGGYGFIRFSLPFFPDASMLFQTPVFVLSVIAVIYTSLVAFRQSDIKKLIAYSSIAHMGLVTLGIFSFNEQGVQGAIFQMISHGLISGALFLCVGVLYDRAHSRDIGYFGGVGAKMPVFALVFMFFTMANIGLPGTSGFVGEILTLSGGFLVSPWAAGAAVSGVILSAVYMLSAYRRLMHGQLDNEELGSIKDLDRREIMILFLLAVVTLVLGILPGLVSSVSAGTTEAVTTIMGQQGLF